MVKGNDLLNVQFSSSKNIRFKISMLRSELCVYSDSYIFVKGRISTRGNKNANRVNKKLIFKNNASFKSCI